MLLNTKYIFFGTPDFAAVILEKLIKAGFPPAAVVCNPDKPVGRKKVITPPPVKARIMNYESGIRERIKILQPEKLDKEFHNSLFQIHDSFDFFIIAAYAKIIPKEILEMPRLGTIGVHPSLLPKYRGSSPIQSIILDGESETGVSLFLADEKVDHGPIFAQRTLNYELGIRNYEELSQKLAELGADLLVETLPKFLNGEITPLPQDETQATYTKKFITKDGYVEPKDLERAQKDGGQIAMEIERKTRALNPEPGVWTNLSSDELSSLIRANGRIVKQSKIAEQKKQGKRMKILEAELTPENKLKLKKIQFEGKTPRMLL